MNSHVDHHPGLLRSVGLLDWLVLLAVVLYLVVSGQPLPSPAVGLAAIGGFAAFLVALRWRHFPVRSPLRRTALAVLVTVAFITAMVTQSGGAASPLINLYLLPLAHAAMTLAIPGVVAVFALVSAAFLGVHLLPGAAGGVPLVLAHVVGELGPFGLVTYLICRLGGYVQFARRRIEDLAERDPLTGLANRQAIDDRLAREHDARSAAAHGRYALLMADLDRMKDVNDRYGHEAGDAALRNAAAAITRATRATDMAGRYGADEFLVFLPDSGPDVAEAVAQRIRNATFQSLFEAGDRMHRMTISVGVATYPRDGRSLAQLLTAAERRMYQDKSLRRQSEDLPPLRVV